MGGEWVEQKSYRNLLWNERTERGLHAIMEMCINFAQVYLRNGYSIN